ncbi:hypothetical protein [Paraburkholderia sp. GAS334]|jgi:hypothetical protein|uniref:hypothetical protein n=1 Tax=Paraburkholderia sp. GAS334 TaxID=3035131 RepID=UPI003D257929
MFNLLVKHTKWTQHGDTISSSRVVTYTDDDLVKPNSAQGDGILFDRLREFPALFVEETDRTYDRMVWIDSKAEAESFIRERGEVL